MQYRFYDRYLHWWRVVVDYPRELLDFCPGVEPPESYPTLTKDSDKNLMIWAELEALTQYYHL